MKKLKRPKVIKEHIEKLIARNQRRIHQISAENYQLRMQLEALEAMPKQEPLTKADLEAREKIETPATAEALDATAEAEQAQGAI